MKISVLIPCYYKHFKNLKNIINLILKGTYQPYEIIISLNGCKFLNNDDILNFENNYKNIKLKLVKTLELLSRPIARNILFPYIEGEIITFCDADDIIHYQRLEIINYFFENHDIDHLLHSYLLSECFKNKNINHCFVCKNKTFNFEKYNLNNIEYMKGDELYKLNFFNSKIKPNVKTVLAYNKKNKQILPHHGFVSVKKEILKNIEFNKNYPRGQDSLFSQEVLYENKKSCVIDANLVIYRNGWIPMEKDYILFKNNIYLNLGSNNPPKPGKPRTIEEINFIQEYFNLIN
jgi:glycosyltransferase involved in cell wall biosynthesis